MVDIYVKVTPSSVLLYRPRCIANFPAIPIGFIMFTFRQLPAVFLPYFLFDRNKLHSVSLKYKYSRRPYNLYCVGADVKPCSVNQIQTLDVSLADVNRFSKFFQLKILEQTCCTYSDIILSPHLECAATLPCEN